MPIRIDTHHHALPEFYRSWLAGLGADLPPAWTPESSRAQLRLSGVSTAILSVPAPQVQLGSRVEARVLARELNQYLHELVVAEPGTFGYFATLPLPDLEGALDELAHAFDRLTPDGVCLLSNTAGTYLGDPVLEPLMAELDRRGAVVFVHPAAPPVVPGLESGAADLLLDVVRAALNLARRGVLTRYPRIRFLLGYAGGFVPYAAGQLAASASPRGNAVDGFRLLRRFWFDTALAGTPWALPSLLKFAPRGQVTYGSDFPLAPRLASWASAGYQRFPRARGAALAYENARRLFPRLVPVIPPIVMPEPRPVIESSERPELER